MRLPFRVPIALPWVWISSKAFARILPAKRRQLGGSVRGQRPETDGLKEKSLELSLTLASQLDDGGRSQRDEGRPVVAEPTVSLTLPRWGSLPPPNGLTWIFSTVFVLRQVSFSWLGKDTDSQVDLSPSTPALPPFSLEPWPSGEGCESGSGHPTFWT